MAVTGRRRLKRPLRWIAALAFVAVVFGTGVSIGLRNPSRTLVAEDTRSEERRAQIATLGDPFSIVMLGDSLTERGMWSELLPNLRIANRGVGGDKVDDVQKAFATIPAGAKEVAVMAGVNDLIAGATADDTLRRYISALEDLRRRGLRIVLESTLFTAFDAINPRVSELDQGLKMYCATAPQCTYLDLNSWLSDGKVLKAEYTLDGLHLAGNAYRIWADQLEPNLLASN
jgi:lysophospholipase L1-like esterase